MTTPNILDATEEFMVGANQPMPEPTLAKDHRAFRMRMLASELKEYTSAEVADDWAEIADGLLDVIVVAWGTLLSYFGPELAREMAHEVWSSNLSKVDGSLGPTVFREDGKVLKPEGWTPPDIAGALQRGGFVDPRKRNEGIE
jgi:predicted HAD superfamily Cof-like phosphohydrolase